MPFVLSPNWLGICGFVLLHQRLQNATLTKTAIRPRGLKYNLLLREKFLDVVVRDNFALECVSAGLVRLYHFDAFGERLTRACRFERCNYFLCHDLTPCSVYLISL